LFLGVKYFDADVVLPYYTNNGSLITGFLLLFILSIGVLGTLLETGGAF
jgi:hypothetical protein